MVASSGTKLIQVAQRVVKFVKGAAQVAGWANWSPVVDKR